MNSHIPKVYRGPNGVYTSKKKTTTTVVQEETPKTEVVHKDLNTLSQKLENLTIGKGVLSRKKYISF